MTHPVPPTDPTPTLCPDCGHAADQHNQFAGCPYRDADDFECLCTLTFGEIVDTARVERIAELEAALEEIAYGPFGKSVAVKNIARKALGDKS